MNDQRVDISQSKKIEYHFIDPPFIWAHYYDVCLTKEALMLKTGYERIGANEALDGELLKLSFEDILGAE